MMARRKAKPAPIASPTMVDESWFSMQRGVDWLAVQCMAETVEDWYELSQLSDQQIHGERRAAEMALWFEDFQRRHGL